MITVARLSTTPVKGCALDHPEAIELTEHGVADDRRYAIFTEDGHVLDGTKLGPIVRVRADLRRADDREQLTLRFPSGEVVDGEVVDGEVELGPPMAVEVYSRTFSVRPVIGPWADALSAYAGRSVTLVRSERLPGERDRNPVSIVSDASVAELARQGNDGAPVDSRRFRMLIELAGAERPHQEDEWIGRDVRVGEAVVRVTRPNTRCVITTQDPETGERDFPTLHVIRGYRGIREGRHFDFGVYAEVVTPAMVRVGDALRLG